MTVAFDASNPSFAEYFDELPLWSAAFGQALLERAPLRRGARILDIGCGTGFLSVELAQRCGPDSRVWAIDPWEPAMDRLQRKLAWQGIANVELVRRSAADTGLPDGVADLAVSNLGINNFADPAAVLAETRRLLRPGGRILLTTNLKGHMAEVYAALRQVLAGEPERLAAVDAEEARRGTQDIVRQRLAAAGFIDVGSEVSSYLMRFADGTAMLDHWFMQMAFAPAWISAAGAEGMAELETYLNAKAKAAGELSLTIPVGVFGATRP